jgi:hypothetical protein
VLDIAVAWFRGVSLLGYRAQHMPIDPYVRHSAGHPAMVDRNIYAEGERRAREILVAEYGWPQA